MKLKKYFLETCSIYLLLLGLWCMASLTTQAQNRFLTTQAEVNDLKSTLRGSTVVTGDLIIGGTSSDITDLSPLNFLLEVTGNFEIRQNSMLEDVGEFPALDSIGGYFLIRTNDSLTSVGSFPRLTTIGESFSVRGNKILRVLYEFPALTSIGDGSAWVPSQGAFVANTSIVVEDNPLLFYCCGLSRFFSGRSNPASGGVYIGSNSTSCNSEEDIGCDISSRLTSDTFMLPFHTTDTTFILHSPTSWRLSREEGTESNWITKLSSGGTPVTDSLMGDQTASITVTYAQNGTSESRTVRLIISFLDESGNNVLDSPVPDTLTLIQEEVMPTLQPSPSTVNVSHFSGSTGITLSANNVKWRLRKDSVADWITMLSVGAISHTDTLTATINSFVPTDTVVTITYDKLPISLADRSTSLVLEAIDNDGGVLDDLSPITITLTQAIAPYMGDITLTTQEGVDTIRNTLGRATAIMGSLTIGSSTDITHLDSLYFLTKITGNLEISNNSMLEDVGDFPALDSIGGNFFMHSNSILRNAGNFPMLSAIGGYFLIRASDSLTSVGSFPRLTTIGESFSVRGSTILRILYEFPALTSIGMGSAWVPSVSSGTSGTMKSVDNVSIVVEDNPLLEYCCVLTRLREGGGITISGGRYINNNFEGCNSIEMSNCSLSVRLSVDDTVRLPFFSEETTFTLYSNTRWQLSRLNPGDADWVTSLSSGVGEGVANNLVGARDTRIKVNHTPNANRESRTVRLLISFLDESGNNVLDSPVPDTLTLIQEEVMPTLQLPPDTVNVSHFSGSTDITLSANNVKWRLRKDSVADWITMLSVGAISHTDTLTATINSFVPTDTVVTITYDKLPISLADRSTSLVLEAIDNDGGVLDDLSPITITLTQAIAPYMGDITLTTQQAVDTIRNTLGNPRVTAIVGNLIIGASTDITNLDSLRFLTEITGDFFIGNTNNGNDSLKDIGGFPFLQKIGGNYYVTENTELVHGGNFPVLDSIGGYFFIRMNAKLESVGSFPRLKDIGTYFSIRSSDSLRSLYEFPALTSIGKGSPYVPSQGSETVNTSIVVENNPLLFYCCGLSRFFSGRSNPASGGVYIGSNSTGCDSEEEISCDISSRLPSDTLRLPFHTTDTTFILHSQTRWRLSREEGTEADWITELSSGGTPVTDSLMGDQTASITVTYAQNGTAESRTARLIISFLDESGTVLDSLVPDTLMLIQEEVMPTLQPSSSTVNVSDLSGNTNITLTANNVKWRLRKDSVADWITMLSVGATNRTDTLIVNNNSFVPTDTMVTITYEELPISLTNRRALLVLESIDDEGNMLENISPITITFTQMAPPYMRDVVLINQAQVDSIRSTLGNPRITVIDGYLQIGPSSDITNLDSLNFLTEITENFFIGGVDADNSALTNIGDFPNLQKIGGGYSVAANTELIHGGNFPVLESIGDEFIASGGTSGEQNSVGRLHGYFFIRSNSKLESLGTFPRLKRIGTSFTARGHDSLRFLYDFPSLISIGTGSPFVPSTPSPGSTSIVVEDNPLLFYCYTLTEFLTGGTHAVSGEIYINNNATGCDSGGEIMASAPHTIMLTSHTDGDSIAIAYNEVATQTIMFSIGGGATGWTSDITGDDFITLDTDMNVAQDTGVAITVRATPTANTGTDDRNATITFTTTGGTGAASIFTVTITQAAPPTFMLTSANTDTIAYDAETASDITFEVGGGATGWWAGVIDRDDTNDFVTLSKPSGSAGLDTIKVTTTVNTGEARVDTVVVGTGGAGEATDTIIVTQEAVPTILLMDPVDGTISIGYAVTDTTITFNVGGSATGWRVTSNHDSLTLSPTSGSSGTGQKVMATFTENRDVLRAATITIITTGQLGDSVTAEVTITQIGASGSPTLEITTPSNAAGDTVVAYMATTTSDSVEIVFAVGGAAVGGAATGWGSMISYGDGVAKFVTLSDTVNADQTDTVKIKVAVTENVGVERSAKIILSTTGQGSEFSSAKDSLTITQSAAPPTFMLTSANTDTIAYDAETASDITFNVGGGATGWWAVVIDGDSDNNFVTLDETFGSAGLDTIKVTTTVNTGVARVDTVVVGTGVEGEATDTIIVTQQEAPPTIVVSANNTTINHDVTSLSISFTLGGTAVGWNSRVTGAGFITLDSSMSTTATKETVTIMATATANTGVERKDTIVFTTGDVSDTVVITQSAGPPTFMLTSANTDTIAYDAETASDITFEVGGGATGWWAGVIDGDSDNNFVMLDTTSGSAGLDTIKVAVNKNMRLSRMDTVVITTVGGTGVLKDTVIVTQAGAPPTLDVSIPTLQEGSNDTTIAYNAMTDIDIITFEVGGGAESWTVDVIDGDDANDFLTLVSTSGDAGAGTVRATPTANTGGERMDTLVITTVGGTGVLTDTIIVTQQEAPPTIEVTIPADVITIDHDVTDAQTIEFNVGGGATGWTASSDSAFVTLDEESGDSGTGIMVMATPMANTAMTARTATVTITTTGQLSDAVTAEVTITQEAAPALMDHTLTFTDLGDTVVTLVHSATTADSITFTLGGGATGWSATSNDTSFIKVPATGSGGAIAVTVVGVANTGSAREAVITVTTMGAGTPVSKTVTITQGAAPTTPPVDLPTLMVSTFEDTTINHDATEALSILFELGGTAVGWEAEVIGDDDFITLTPSESTSDTNTAVTVMATYEANDGVERKDTIVFTTGDVSDTVVITQRAPPPIFTLTSDDAERVAYDAETASDITFNVGGGATAWWAGVIDRDEDTNDFVTLSKLSGSAGLDTIKVTTTVNTGEARVDTVVVGTGGKGEATDTIIITQEAIPTIVVTDPVDGTISTDYNEVTKAITFEVGGSATNWTASSDQSFVTLDITGGASGTGLMATVTENRDVQRTATITITTEGQLGAAKTATVMITQRAAPPIFTLTSDDAERVAYDAETASDITFNVGGGATAWWAGVIDSDSDNNFVTLSKLSGSAGLDTIKVTTTVNTGEARVDTVVVGTGGAGEATDTIIVTQEAVPTILLMDPVDGTISIGYAVTDTTITFNVGGSATGWRVTSNHDSLTLSPTSGSSGTEQVMATFTENRDVLRAATITIITTGQLGDSVTAEVTITQIGASGSPTLEITTPSNAAGDTTVAYMETTTSDSVEIVFAVGGSATGWGSMISYGDGVDKFVTLSDTVNADQTDTVKIKVAVTANVGVERSAKIILSTTGQGSEFSSAKDFLTITQAGAPPTLDVSIPTLQEGSNDTTIAYDAETASDITFEVGGGATGWWATVIDGDGNDFLTLSSDTTGNAGTATISVTSIENSGKARMDTIVITTVGGTGVLKDTVIVTQEAVPTLSVDISSFSLGHDEGDAQNIVVTLGGSATGWNARSDSAFVDITTSIGGNGDSATFTLSSNDTGSERTAEIVITTDGSIGSDSAVTVMITQEAAPTLSVDISSFSLSHDEGAAQNIVVTLGGSATGWNARSDSAFVDITTSIGGNGDSATFTLSSNDTGSERTAEIVITTDGSIGSDSAVTVMITQEAAPTLSVDISSFSLGHDEGAAQNIVVTLGGSATGWNARSDSAFVDITTSIGGNGDSATFTLSSNDTGSERTAEIVITTDGSIGSDSAVTVMITQEAAPTLSVDISSFSLGHDEGAAQNIVVTLGGSATGWNARSDSAFVDITTSIGGNGDSATFTLSSNDTGSERTAEIVITTDGSIGSDSAVTVMITQEAVPTLSVDISSFSLGHDEGAAQNIVVTLGGSATGWNARSDSAFVDITTSIGGNGDSATFTLSSNDTGSERTAEIVITTDGSIGSDSAVTVMITQEAVPTLSVDISSFSLGHDEGDAQNIVVTLGGSATGWNARSDSAFVDITTSIGGNGDSATFTLSSNDTGSERTAEIVITTDGSIGSDSAVTVMITQEAAPTLSVDISSFSLGHDEGAAQNIVVTLGGSATGWNARSDSAFVDITTSIGGNGDSATFTLSSNDTGSERTAEIVITTDGSIGSDSAVTVMITQEAAPAPGAPTLSVDISSFSLGHDEGAAQNIVVTLGGSATGWNARSDSAFVDITTSIGGNGDSATFTLSSNDTGSERTAEIVITTDGSIGSDSAVTVMITQEAVPTLSVDISSFSLGHDEGAAQNIVVTLGGSATGWNARSDSAFVDITTSIGGNGDSATFTLSSNDTGSERTAEIVITTDGSIGSDSAVTVMITQEAAPAPGAPTLSVDISSFSLGHDEGAAQNIVVTLGGSATGWNARSDSAFVDITTSIGGNGDSATFTLSSNDTGSERTAEIVITTDGSIGSDSAVTVMITQEAVPTLSVDISSFSLGHDEGDAQNIVVTLGGSATGWNARSDSAFVDITTSIGGNGDSATFTLSSNDTGSERTAEIVITTDGSIGSDSAVTVMITQEAAPVTLDPATLIVSTFEDTTINHDATEALSILFELGGTAVGWEAEVIGDDDFITLTPSESTSDTNTAVTVMATYKANTGVERKDTIVFTTGDVSDTVVITQRAAPPIFTLTSDDAERVAYDAETASDITFNVGGGATGWWAGVIDGDSDNNFVMLDKTSGSAGLDTIKVTTTVNTGVARVDTVVVGTGGEGEATDTIIVTQQEAPPVVVVPATLMVSTFEDTTINDEKGSLDITFTLGGTAKGWTSAVKGADFITLTRSESTSDTNTAVTVMATYEANAGVERKDTIVFTTTRGVTGMITITQRAAPSTPAAPTISITTTDEMMIEANDTSAISVVFTVGGNATGWGSTVTGDFITLDTAMNIDQTGEITIQATPAANTGAERVAKIVISTTGGGTAVSDSITITQKAGKKETDLGISLDESLTLYPNPTDGVFFIEGLSGALEVHVHDLLGRQVATHSLSAGERKVDISALSSGMYVITLKESGGELLTRILIKQ